MIKPKRPETGTWKVNVAKNKGAEIKPKVTFDMLFDKYSKQKVVPSDRSLKKKNEITSSPRKAYDTSKRYSEAEE